MKKLLCVLYTGIMLVMFSFVTGAAYSAGRVSTTGGNLNVRSSPSVSSTAITSVKNSSMVTLTEKSGSWYKAVYADGKSGWLHGDYISAYPTSYEVRAAVTSGGLNVRSGRGTSYSITDRLINGEKAVVLSVADGWAHILFDGNETGYVSEKYIKKTHKYTPVSLSVPYYMQTDSRWKNYPIGTYGDTIGTIGCTTTAIAMTESYHSGNTVTPPMMASRLSYSPSGSLYWPSYYYVENAGSNYLEVIYRALEKGKPVVFGAKKSNGSQHWVTVTGYKGSGDTLSASDFTVNDPGTKTVRLLSELLYKNPVPYRIVYRK